MESASLSNDFFPSKWYHFWYYYYMILWQLRPSYLYYKALYYINIFWISEALRWRIFCETHTWFSCWKVLCGIQTAIAARLAGAGFVLMIREDLQTFWRPQNLVWYFLCQEHRRGKGCCRSHGIHSLQTLIIQYLLQSTRCLQSSSNTLLLLEILPTPSSSSIAISREVFPYESPESNSTIELGQRPDESHRARNLDSMVQIKRSTSWPAPRARPPASSVKHQSRMQFQF